MEIKQSAEACLGRKKPKINILLNEPVNLASAQEAKCSSLNQSPKGGLEFQNKGLNLNMRTLKTELSFLKEESETSSDGSKTDSKSLSYHCLKKPSIP